MNQIILPSRNYDLPATLDSGQVFRWYANGGSWHGVVGKRVVRLTQVPAGIHAATDAPLENWDWLRRFLQTDIDFPAVLKTFPDDEPMRQAVAACSGLRLLRQDPWECLASFILSSTKQIVQIRQIVARLCERFGEPLPSSERGHSCPPESKRLCEPLPPLWSAGLRPGEFPYPNSDQPGPNLGWVINPALPFAFPTPQQIAAVSEAALRECKMGFRAPHLLAAARQIADGGFVLESLRQLDCATARAELMRLRGVGGKIADCVLLFAYGFDGAFPVDVWVARALQKLYFSRRRASEARLRKFAATHFGPHAGYAQQYLFHYMRTKNRA